MSIRYSSLFVVLLAAACGPTYGAPVCADTSLISLPDGGHGDTPCTMVFAKGGRSVAVDIAAVTSAWDPFADASTDSSNGNSVACGSSQIPVHCTRGGGLVNVNIDDLAKLETLLALGTHEQYLATLQGGAVTHSEMVGVACLL